MSEVSGPSDSGARPIINSKKWDDWKKKYQEREERALKKLQNKTGAADPQALAKQAREALTKRQMRSSDHKPIGAKEVKINPTSEEINDMKKDIQEELKKTNQTFQEKLPRTHLNSLADKVTGLKGRVSEGSP